MKKRSIKIAGHPTSISMEEPFWQALKALSDADDRSLGSLITEIDAQRGDANLSSALRVWVLHRLMEKAGLPSQPE